MQTISEQYIVDAQGQRLSVVVEFDYYQKLLCASRRTRRNLCL